MPQTLGIDLLRTFHTVARLGRFKDAAAHLAKSSSAVSVHIQRLEELAGARLFERDNQGIALSPQGQHLLKETAGLLAEHDRILGVITAAPVTGRLRIGLPEDYAGPILRQVLPLFAMENPGIALEIEAGMSDTLSGLHAKGKLDAALIVTPAGERPAESVLARLRPVWTVGETFHRLPPSLPVAFYAMGCPYRGPVTALLEAWGGAWHVVITSTNSGAIAAAVESGMAVAVMDGPHLGPGLRAAPASLGLPELPPFEIVYLGKDSPAGARFAAAIRRYFSRTESH